MDAVRLSSLSRSIIKKPTLDDLPDEVIQQILFYVPPQSLGAFSQTSKRLQSSTQAPLLWRYQCCATFTHWCQSHDIAKKLAQPATDVDWRTLLIERLQTSKKVNKLVNDTLASQQKRIEKLENIAEAGYDAKDDLLRQAHTSEDVEDWLARRWWSEAALGLIHRRKAIEVWMKVARNEPDVTLEEALGAFDVFTLGTRQGDFEDISRALDNLAADFRKKYPEADAWSTRQKALMLIRFLRQSGFLGVHNQEEDYHAIQNNFIGFALLDKQHQSLPLVLVAIYICLARRFGVEAYAMNTPMHIYGRVEAPEGKTLDGELAESGEPREKMYIDPYRHADETTDAEIRNHLFRAGVSEADFERATEAASIKDLVARTTRNIMTSVNLSREQGLAMLDGTGRPAASWTDYNPPLDESMYGALWALLIVQTRPSATADPRQSAHLAASRSRMLPLLQENLHANCPWDVCLLEDYVLPMFLHGLAFTPDGAGFAFHREGVTRMFQNKELLSEDLRDIRLQDNIRRPPQLRPKPPPGELELQQQREDPRSWSSWLGQASGLEANSQGGLQEKVQYRIGNVFLHRRYGYEGVIVGWDTKCEKDENWISQMGVNNLDGGRQQSFYHVL